MQVYFLITERCNLNCPFCIRGAKATSNMTLVSFLSILKNNDFSQDTLVITGGEPSLVTDLDRFVEYASKSSKNVVLCSNGFSVLSKNYDNLTIQLSLDGNKCIHDSIRGENSFDKVFAAFEYYKKSGFRVCISTTVSKENHEHILELVNLINDLQPNYWKVNLNQEDWLEENGVGIEKWNNLVDKVLDCCYVRLLIKKQFKFPKNIKKIPDPDYLNCGSCRNKVYVYPDFTVYPCTCLKKFALGNLLNKSLKDILKQSNSLAFKNYRPIKSEICMKCDYINICNGGCIGASYKKNGELGYGDPRCPFLFRGGNNV